MAEEVTTPDIYDGMFYENVRIEAMWPFPMSPAPQILETVFEDDDENLPREIKALIKKLPEDIRTDLLDGDSRNFQSAWEELCAAGFRKNVKGWLGIANCPVMRKGPAGGAQFSWGYYKSLVLFAPDADALVNKAVDWAKAEFEQVIAPAGGAA